MVENSQSNNIFSAFELLKYLTLIRIQFKAMLAIIISLDFVILKIFKYKYNYNQIE